MSGLNNQLLKAIKTYGSLLPVLFVALPFLFSFIMLMIFSEGDRLLTSLLIQEVGLFNIWVDGAIVALDLSLSFVALAIVIFGWKDINDRSWPVVILISAATIYLFFATPIAAVLGGVLALIARLFKSSKPDSSAETTKPSEFFAAYFLFIVLMALVSYPLSHSTILVDTDGNTVNANVLTHSDDAFIVVNSDTDQIELLNNNKWSRVGFCRTGSKSFLSRTIVSLISEEELITKCS